VTGGVFDDPLDAFHYSEPAVFEVAPDETRTYARSGITSQIVQHTDEDGAVYPTMVSLEVADGAETHLDEDELRRLAGWLLQRADDLARLSAAGGAWRPGR
jgi:hypothetical protein